MKLQELIMSKNSMKDHKLNTNATRHKNYRPMCFTLFGTTFLFLGRLTLLTR